MIVKCLTKCLTEANDEQKTEEVNISFAMMEVMNSSNRRAILVDVH